MSVDLLREAAALMRERAKTAADSKPHWSIDFDGYNDPTLWASRDEYDQQPAVILTHQDLDEEVRGAFDHIASWPPPVALAVAAMLEDQAETAELFTTKQIPASAWSMNWQTAHNAALTVARAYLGRDA